MVVIMSTFLSIEFIQALNPLYAFPIVAVILLAFIVYAFGFKSPAQPPSFDTIDEEKKSTKKRKTKDTNKVKVVQNGKLNGSNLNKNQVSVSSKKKEAEKSPSAEKPQNEKKVTKKSKSSNEKKGSQEKKKDSFSVEDTGEGGWVQLISKKGRKNRKKDEATNVERQTCIVKPVQNLQINNAEEIILSEEKSKADMMENLVPEKKLVLKDEVNETAPNVENLKEKALIIEDFKVVDQSIEKKACDENISKNEKLNEENTTKSKKKKKKNNPEINTSSNILTNAESSAEQVISENSAPLSSINQSPVATETSNLISKSVDEQLSKETKTSESHKTLDTNKISDTNKTSDTHKTSNVVFDELAGLYPEPKEQRKKKRVRRDH